MLTLVLGQKKGTVVATKTTYFTPRNQSSLCLPFVWRKLFLENDITLGCFQNVYSCVEPGYPTLHSVVHGFLQGMLTAMPCALWQSISWVEYVRHVCLKRGATTQSLFVMHRNDNQSYVFILRQDSQDPIVMTWTQVRNYVLDQKIDCIFSWGNEARIERSNTHVYQLTLGEDDWKDFLEQAASINL